MREHRYALTKDLSKFYQRVDADELAQHVRRVVWRGGDQSREPDIYVTTTVNFGDMPAGCITIAALRETAVRFGKGLEEAAWFLMHRTYVDDATGGADSKEGLIKISVDLEEIAAHGGFTFKETLMSGDRQEEGDERKVLGLIWDTERDQLQVDVKVNFSCKKRGAREEPDESLTELETTVPERITKRALYRVVMGQYDP
jgi:hypothetical protein